MEQIPIPANLIVFWLGDYTHFICDQFGFPHDQADRLLQQYLDRTVEGSPPQPARSPSVEPAKYPEILDSSQNTPCHEQPSNPSSASALGNLLQGYEAPASPQQESYIQEADDSTNVTGLTPRDTNSQILSLLRGRHSANMTITDSDLSGNNPLSTQSSEPSNKTPIGSIWDYDPLWVQRNNIDIAMVEEFTSPIKFDALFTSRIITIGDILTFQVSPSTDRKDRKTEAHLQVRYKHRPTRRFMLIKPDHR